MVCRKYQMNEFFPAKLLPNPPIMLTLRDVSQPTIVGNTPEASETLPTIVGSTSEVSETLPTIVGSISEAPADLPTIVGGKTMYHLK